MKPETPSIETIDAYIQGFPEHVQKLLSQMRETIRKAAPGATEKISYRMPAFAQDGTLVYFAAFTHHIGFYPTSSGIAAFQDDLKKYKSSKGAVQFPIGEPLPLDLVTRIVKFRVAETSGPRRALPLPMGPRAAPYPSALRALKAKPKTEAQPAAKGKPKARGASSTGKRRG